MYAVEPDDDGLWYHQVLDANWGGLEAAEDVSIKCFQVVCFINYSSQ